MAGKDYSRMPAYELKSLLKSRNMPTTGIKEDLARRLAEDDDLQAHLQDVKAREKTKAAAARKKLEEDKAARRAAEMKEWEKKKAAKENMAKNDGKDDSSQQLGGASTSPASKPRTSESSPKTKSLEPKQNTPKISVPTTPSPLKSNASTIRVFPPTISSATLSAVRAERERNALATSKSPASNAASSPRQQDTAGSSTSMQSSPPLLPVTPKRKITGMQRSTATAVTPTPTRKAGTSTTLGSPNREQVPPKPSPTIKTENRTPTKTIQTPNKLIERNSHSMVCNSLHRPKTRQLSLHPVSEFSNPDSSTGFQSSPDVNAQIPTSFQTPFRISKYQSTSKIDGSIAPTWSTPMKATTSALSQSPVPEVDPRDIAPKGPRIPTPRHRDSSATSPYLDSSAATPYQPSYATSHYRNSSATEEYRNPSPTERYHDSFTTPHRSSSSTIPYRIPSATKRSVGSPTRTPSKKLRLEEIEPTGIRLSIKGQPYAFVSYKDIEVTEDALQDLKTRAKENWGFTGQVRADRRGYFFVFEDSRRGDREASDFVDKCRGLWYRGSAMNMRFGRD